MPATQPMRTLDPDDLQPLDADGLAWLVYLVVDPSVEPTSYPEGEVVYVGEVRGDLLR